MKILLINIILLLTLSLNAQSYKLEYYLEQAKVNSPLIKQKENDNKLIQLNLQKVKSILTKPLVNVEANLLFAPIISHDDGSQFLFISDGTTSDYTGYDLSYADGGQYQAFISVKQSLFSGSTYKAFSQQAEIENRLNENEIQLSKHEIEQLVAHQYILCLQAKQQSDISLNLLEKLNKQFRTLKELVNNAIYKPSDLILMQIEIDNYKIEYQNYTIKYQNNLADLNLLCGINDKSIVEIEAVNFSLSPDTVKTSFFLQQYKLDSFNIQSHLLLSEQKYKPQLHFFANAGLNATYLPSPNRLGFSTGLNFTWNIFDGHQKKIQYQKSLIEIQNLEFKKQHFAKQYDLNKSKYLTQIKTIDTQIDIVQKQLNKYEKLIDLYQLQFSQGQISIMNFKNIIRDISFKKQEELKLKMQKQLLINSYNYWNF